MAASASDEEFDDTKIETPRSIRSQIQQLGSSVYLVDSEHDAQDEYRPTGLNERRFASEKDGVSDNEYPELRIIGERKTLSTVPLYPPEVNELKPSFERFSASIVDENPSVRRGNIEDKHLYSSPIRRSVLPRRVFNSPPSNLHIHPLKFIEESKGKYTENPSTEQINFQESQSDSNPNFSIKHNAKELTSSKPLQSTDPVSSNDGSQVHNKSLNYGNFEGKISDISRANLLERVNQTLDSISSPDRIGSRSSQPMQSQSATQNQEYSSSSESDAFAEKLQFTGRNLSPILGNSTPKFDRKEISGSNSFKVEPSNSYSNPIMKKDSIYGDSNSSRELSNDWSPQKWKMLYRVIKSKKIGLSDALKSESLISELGCTSKLELLQRINFLVDYQKILQKKRNSKKGK